MKKRIKKQKFPVIGILILILVFVFCIILFFPNQTRRALSFARNAGLDIASVILSHNFRTLAQIQSHYNATSPNSSKVRVLIVPGHEPNYGGAEFGNLKERDMNVELGQDLQRFLSVDPHFEVFITRDSNGWNPEFASYFQNNWNDISQWMKASHDEFSHLVSIGEVAHTYSTIIHNKAPLDVATRLYGITKWSNENNMDIVIHVHFNDNPRKNTSKAGDYSGFAMYVPASQYGNSTTTKTIAGNIFNRLKMYNPVSDFPGESNGVIDEPSLIAIGSNNTSDAASLLIEYRYIYEPQLQDPKTRSVTLNNLAYATYLGLQDFFDQNSSVN